LFKSYPLTSRFAFFLVIPIIVVATISLLRLYGSLPQEQGKVSIRGLSSEVTISRGKHSIVSIQAKHDEDVYFAMGFVHAQDRLWQLELQRHISQGRLSELFGRASLKSDVWIRTLGIYESAKDSWEHLTPESRQSLTAYTAGINAWIEQENPLPTEFVALGVEPEPWNELDSLAWMKMFALNLSNNMWREIEFLSASQVLSKDKMNFLFDNNNQDLIYTSTYQDLLKIIPIEELSKVREDLETNLHIGGKNVGSNAWVVAGKFTETGLPILASDPHLSLQIPSLWYAVKQEGSQLNSTGMSLVGLPLVIFGKNENIAWGGTSMLADVQDLYIEQLNPENNSQYLYNGQWIDFDVRTESIKIKTDSPEFMNRPLKPIDIQIRSTVHGPIISDAADGFESPVSLSWTALKPGDTTYNALFEINYSENYSSFRNALSKFVAPTLNYIYADTKNNIGYVAAGNIPIRKSGNGQYPAEGWNSDYMWQGYIEKNMMPSSLNPKQGYIVSANNRIVDSSYPFFISKDWASPERAMRIEELLLDRIAKKQLIDSRYFKQMQGDTVDISAKRFVSLIRNMNSEVPIEKEAIELVKAWDGDMSKDSIAASIFHVWMKNLKSQMFSDDLFSYWNRKDESRALSKVWRNTTNAQIYSALSNERSNWCDNITSEEVESCDYILHSSLRIALKELIKLRGKDIEDWSWGELHYVSLEHQPFGQVNALNLLFNRTLSTGGSPNTINVADAQFRQSKGYVQSFGAGFRQVIELSNESNGYYFMNSTGQSGNVFSDYYDDMFERFFNVEYIDFEESLAPSHATKLVLASDSVSRK